MSRDVNRIVEPRILRGFRDYPPALMIPRERLMELARGVFRSYGFAPIDTPAIELTEVLTAKVEDGAEIQKQLYRFQDAGDRDVSLRFDLTVPLARFIAQHAPTLGLPFKRYHLGIVWRGESPQTGRFREFMQCDFDILGSTSSAADIEIALVINDLLAALGVDRFTIRVNNRVILNGLLEELGLADRSGPLLRVLDKLAKIGGDAVTAEMVREAGVTDEQARRVIGLAQTTGTNEQILDDLDRRFAGNASAAAGTAALRRLVRTFREVGVPEGRLAIDLSICRGLDYYTGTVFETFLGDKPEIGSVCSGGRYDNLAGCYTRQSIPGVGASLGLDRLLAAMEALGLIPAVAGTAPVLVLMLDADRLGDYQRIAALLRREGIGTEVYAEPAKLGKQFQYAERRGARIALIAGTEEFNAGLWKVKNLAVRSEESVAEPELIAHIQRILGT